MCVKETLITSEQDVTGEKQHERNEEWYDQECGEMVEVKQEARLKCIQHSTRANQEDYNRKRIPAYRVCRRKKRELLKTKVDDIVHHHTKNESKKYYKKPRYQGELKMGDQFTSQVTALLTRHSVLIALHQPTYQQ
jgi:hypothetical protein